MAHLAGAVASGTTKAVNRVVPMASGELRGEGCSVRHQVMMAFGLLPVWELGSIWGKGSGPLGKNSWFFGISRIIGAFWIYGISRFLTITQLPHGRGFRPTNSLKGA